MSLLNEAQGQSLGGLKDMNREKDHRLPNGLFYVSNFLNSITLFLVFHAKLLSIVLSHFEILLLVQLCTDDEKYRHCNTTDNINDYRTCACIATNE